MAKAIIQFNDFIGPNWSPSWKISKYQISILNLNNKKEEYSIDVNEKVNNCTVFDDMIYFGSEDKHVYAINILTRKELWKFETGGHVKSTPIVSNKIVFIVSSDNHLYALDVDTGREIWKFKMIETEKNSYSGLRPIIFKNYIIFSGFKDKSIYALNITNGELVWKFEAKDWIMSSPNLKNNVIYFGSNDKHLYALDPNTGEEIWKFEAKDYVKESLITEDIAYFGCNDSYIYAVDTSTGNEIWKYKTEEMWARGRLILNNDVLYMGGNYIYSINSATGKEIWKKKSAKNGSVIYVDNDNVYVHSTDNKIYCIDTQTGDKKDSFFAGYPLNDKRSFHDKLICLPVSKEIDNEYADKEFENRKKMLNKFLKKYDSNNFGFSRNISEYFKADEDEGIIEMINFDDEMELLVPENYNNFLTKFLSSDINNSRGVGFGHNPFEDTFYLDLFNIFENNGVVDSDITGTLSGNFEGYYSFATEFKPNGIMWHTEFYGDEEDEYEDW
tara:strand:- start:267 stop:1766 length:1500 start_codon:yes stop_codon:yes gene_type:complete